MRSDAERLADILDATDKITVKAAEGRDAFDDDEYVQLALIHLVQIIGEAANQLSSSLIEASSEIPWRQIVATRNRVVHGYFEVDLDILWVVVSVEIPKLAAQIRALIESSG